VLPIRKSFQDMSEGHCLLRRLMGDKRTTVDNAQREAIAF
jgi:hypothetical protein